MCRPCIHVQACNFRSPVSSHRTMTFMRTVLAATLLSRNVIVSSAFYSPFSPVSTSTSLRMSSSDAAKRVLVPIADDSEEIETTCITDTLTRFGASVTVASVKPDGELVCKMSRGIKFMADTTIDAAAKEEWDLIALPGGMPGAEHLRDSEPLIVLLEKQKAAKKTYAAVCASPAVVFASKGLLPEDSATCYPAPGFREAIKAVESNDEVVVSGNVITSQGPGTSLKFALQLGESLYGKEKADEIAAQMLVER